MTLLLLRHADAVARAASDEERVLTDKGCRQARAVAEFCQRNEIEPDLVLTSPYRRARQTAQIISATAREVEWLASGMSPETAVRKIRALEETETVMLVGHEPDFSELAAHLLGLPCGAALHLRKASLTAIELSPTGATLEFCVPVKLMSATQRADE